VGFRDHTDQIFKKLNILKFSRQVIYRSCLYGYKNESFDTRDKKYINTRNINAGTIDIPIQRTVLYANTYDIRIIRYYNKWKSIFELNKLGAFKLQMRKEISDIKGEMEIGKIQRGIYNN
jgi:hypothetical protein